MRSVCLCWLGLSHSEGRGVVHSHDIHYPSERAHESVLTSQDEVNQRKGTLHGEGGGRERETVREGGGGEGEGGERG